MATKKPRSDSKIYVISTVPWSPLIVKNKMIKDNILELFEGQILDPMLNKNATYLVTHS